MTEKQIMEHILTYIGKRGYTCACGLVENFYLSLKSRPFVLMAGRSNMDMTLLPRLFAESIGATAENGRFLCLRVPMDWMDSSDLFGWLNLEGKFIPGPIIDFLKKAQNDPDKPYFLYLDTLILSRSEYYLREFLGAVESREQEQSKPIVTMAYYGSDEEAKQKYGEIPALDNLYVVGSFNLDETSLPLNQRLLDRVHTLRLDPEDITGSDTGLGESLEIHNDFLKTRYFRLDQCRDRQEVLLQDFAVLESFNKILSGATAYLGFRSRNDAVLYQMHNRLTGVLPEEGALDHEISQKVLTRVQGSAKTIKPVLCKLFSCCCPEAGELDPQQPQAEVMTQAATELPCIYPASAKHIARMIAICEAEGYASYWN